MDSVAKTRRILWIPGGNHPDSFYGQHASHTPVMRIGIKEKPPGRLFERKTRLEPEAAPRTASRLSRYPRLPDGRLPLGGLGVARPGHRLLLSQNDGHKDRRLS